MKKVLILILCLAMALPLAACAPTDSGSGSDSAVQGTDTRGTQISDSVDVSQSDMDSGSESSAQNTQGEEAQPTDTSDAPQSGSGGGSTGPTQSSSGKGTQTTDTSDTPQSDSGKGSGNSTQSTNTGSGQTTDTSDTPQKVEEINLELKYDDFYTFPAKIKEVETLTVTSRKTGTRTEDTYVLRRKSGEEPSIGIAAGCGTARVTLENGKVYKVTVTPATVSVLLILGQSNAEGSTGGTPDIYGTSRMNSIVCDRGQVYSTYAWSTEGHSLYVAGLNSKKHLTEANAGAFVGKALNSVYAWDGRLEYPMNSLTADGGGKVGFDSGLAWKWNQLTGEKVWVVNCAAGSTKIEEWVPGATRYKNCVALMKYVNKTMQAEIDAGHYVLNHFAYFWLQGEKNCNDSEAYYDSYFSKMHSGFMKDLRLPGGKAPEYCGIVMVRAYKDQPGDSYADDVKDNGVRTAQKKAAAATTGIYSNVFLACQDNDLWISDEAVTKYWATRYPNSKRPYTVRSGGYKNPTTVKEVHYVKTHYLQPGYNEIGIVTAEAAVKMMYGK